MQPLTQQLIPPTAQGVPGQVAELDTKARAAVEAFQRSITGFLDADAANKRAASDDAAAASEAVKAGKKVPPTVVPERRDALDRARRTKKVLEDEARSALRELHNAVAVEAAGGEWLAGQHKRVTERREIVDELVERLAAAFDDLAAEGAILDALLRFRGGVPRSAKNRSFALRRSVGANTATFRAVDGHRVTNDPHVRPTQAALTEALKGAADGYVASLPDPRQEERDRAEREEFRERQQTMAQVARGGIAVWGGMQ